MGARCTISQSLRREHTRKSCGAVIDVQKDEIVKTLAFKSDHSTTPLARKFT